MSVRRGKFAGGKDYYLLSSVLIPVMYFEKGREGLNERMANNHDGIGERFL